MGGRAMTGLAAAVVFARVAAAAFVLGGATAFLAATRFLGVAAAFFPAAGALRIFEAVLAAFRDFWALGAFLAADFLEADFDLAMFASPARLQVYRPWSL